ncbi:hypothetical protein C8J46_11218 [Sphingomonas sp. PP-F2F-A104-K0414]|nr:hypothetical protein C8J46_11218 [Sphingomonas sp. PP-F2F-A104-K0414]
MIAQTNERWSHLARVRLIVVITAGPWIAAFAWFVS